MLHTAQDCKAVSVNARRGSCTESYRIPGCYFIKESVTSALCSLFGVKGREPTSFEVYDPFVTHCCLLVEVKEHITTVSSARYPSLRDKTNLGSVQGCSRDDCAL